jgi:hypothetical protein
MEVVDQLEELDEGDDPHDQEHQGDVLTRSGANRVS